MSRDLRDLLEAAAHEPVGLPTPEETRAAGRSRRRVRRVAAAAGSAVVIVAVALGAVALLGDSGPRPEVVDQPPGTPASPQPEPSATVGSESSGDGETVPSLGQLAVASTMSLDGGMTYESWFPQGTVVREVDDGVSYPERIHGLADGTVVWQGASGIHVLGPEDEMAATLVATPADPAARIHLAGTGEVDGEPVVLVTESRAASPEDDDGGTMSAYRLDGTSTVLIEFPSAWEFGIDTATSHGGWLLYTVGEAGEHTTVLRAPDGTETFIEQSYGEGDTLQAAALAEIDIAPGLAVIEHHVEYGDPDAPFGAAHLEVRSVDEATAGEPAWSIALPTDNVPKQLTVAGEWAYLTLLPDASDLLQIDLHDGSIERFSAPGIVALHEGLQPRAPNAAPPAACADSSGTTTADAQAYVWLPCLEAATYEEGDPREQFFGIHKPRLVTDPRASSGGVAQRVEMMLETIFAGPTPEEQAQGYSGIIDPSVAALAGVAFDDGLVTIDLTDEGARAASIGTTARAVFQATVEAAVFGGFVDVDALRITVESDCVAWSTYGEGEPACFRYHRDGRTTEDSRVADNPGS